LTILTAIIDCITTNYIIQDYISLNQKLKNQLVSQTLILFISNTGQL